MTERAHVFGTDNGPECPKCAGTVWGYIVREPSEEDVRVTASACCIGCAHTEDFIMARVPADAVTCREMHEVERGDKERIEGYRRHLTARQWRPHIELL